MIDPIKKKYPRFSRDENFRKAFNTLRKKKVYPKDVVYQKYTWAENERFYCIFEPNELTFGVYIDTQEPDLNRNDYLDEHSHIRNTKILVIPYKLSNEEVTGINSQIMSILSKDFKTYTVYGQGGAKTTELRLQDLLEDFIEHFIVNEDYTFPEVNNLRNWLEKIPTLRGLILRTDFNVHNDIYAHISEKTSPLQEERNSSFGEMEQVQKRSLENKFYSWIKFVTDSSLEEIFSSQGRAHAISGGRPLAFQNAEEELRQACEKIRINEFEFDNKTVFPIVTNFFLKRYNLFTPIALFCGTKVASYLIGFKLLFAA
ncbi:MAG: hypothetical protein AAF502_07960, partial [Bacteroidota bacterium]